MHGSTGSLKAGLKMRLKSKKNMSETTTNALVEMSTLSGGGGGGGVSLGSDPETDRPHKADPPPPPADSDMDVKSPASPQTPPVASNHPSRDPHRRASSIGIPNALAFGQLWGAWGGRRQSNISVPEPVTRAVRRVSQGAAAVLGGGRGVFFAKSEPEVEGDIKVPASVTTLPSRPGKAKPRGGSVGMANALAFGQPRGAGGGEEAVKLGSQDQDGACGQRQR